MADRRRRDSDGLNTNAFEKKVALINKKNKKMMQHHVLE